MERAITMITAYCAAVEDDDVDEDPTEALFDILYDLEQPFFDAVTEREQNSAGEAYGKTVIALVSIVRHLLDHLALCLGDDEEDEEPLTRFTLLSGMAQELYGSMV